MRRLFRVGCVGEKPIESIQSATEGERPVTRQHSILALLFLLWVACLGPLQAQESAVRRGSSRTSGGVSQARGTNRPGARPSATRTRVVPASNPIILDEGEVIQGEPIGEVIMDGGEIYEEEGFASCNGDCGGSCSSCSHESGYCASCNTPRRFCICLPSHGYVQVEYLLWWQNGMNLPPLVTTSPSGTARASAGVLPAASVLFGGDDTFLNGSHHGGRIRFGTWFDRCPGLGMEGEYFGLAQSTESFFQQSTGNPILARPFFNIVTGQNDAELVAFPNVLSGSISVDVDSQFHGAAARFRRSLCASSGCAMSSFCCDPVPTSSRLDATLGYRYYELKESLGIQEQLQSTTPNSPGSFNISDNFQTLNQFNGLELGVLWQGRRGLWSLDTLMRVGIGNSLQTVTISGSTATLENGVTTNTATGILAERTNIGEFDRNQFVMIPELGATLGYQLTRCLRLTTGYSMIYWGNVVRPGDQVSLDVNPNLFAPESNPLTGALRPQFQFVSSDYWVQGLSFGADFRW